MMENYIVITPVRDEEDYIRFTLDSVVSQTMKPLEWIIVDDGSRDGTGAILDEYSSRYDWIRVVRRADRGCRVPGTGVMEAFYDGYAAVTRSGWDFIVKLDGDLSFSADYFENCFSKFREYPDLGICGGDIYNVINGTPVLEPVPRFHVRGATKIYRKSCWDQIGGLIKAPGWDTLDEVKANMLGWSTRSLPELKLLHHRPTGAAQGSWKDYFKHGRANYISGYHPVFMLLKCCKRLFQSPHLIGPAGLLAGFVSGYLQGVPQVADKELIKYLRKQQMKTLTGQRSLWNQA
ncbi:MAG: glycosyltransferase family A protein [Syntrophobacteraceae bacterium]